MPFDDFCVVDFIFHETRKDEYISSANVAVKELMFLKHMAMR